MFNIDNEKLITILMLAIGGLLYYFYRLRSGGGGGKPSSSSSRGPVLQTYTRDLSAEAEGKKLDPVIGREDEIERVIHILARRSKNNPLLLGEPGVGKTAVVEGIARRIAAGDVPGRLREKRVLALDLGGLISGTKYRGEFEERMKKITDEIKGMGRTIILFIDEIHMIEQAKGAEGAMNVSDILKPALSRGELQAIGATTWKEYNAFIKPDDALNRRFQPVVIGEPSPEATLQILRGIKGAYEEHHNVLYEDAALKAAVDLSSKHITDRFLPDKAIDLLDEAGAKVSIESSHNTKHAKALLASSGESVTTQLAALQRDRRELDEELGHLKKMGEHITDPELEGVQRRIGHLIGEIDKADARIKEKRLGKIPRVRVADMKDIVEHWIGKKLK
ncbi:ATP-dependent Clp protease ATP-binding subunit [Candidatus Uhrbacteria bacterium]|nr:ATP-dependent Clp protease ATP-binding subunit [Candidatus Uhrbacteria bacterium]